MNRKQISVSWVAIYVSWVAAFALWGTAWLIDSNRLGQLAVMIATVAATVTVREFFIEHDDNVRNVITVLRLAEYDENEKPQRLRPMK